MPSSSRSMEQVCGAARWTEADALVVVREFRRSGLSAEEFGRQHGLHPVRVIRWAARVSDEVRSGRDVPLLLPVHVTAPMRVLVEIALGERILRVPADLDEVQVARLVRAVESA